MKPSFALFLSFDGIRLLHRAAGGWRTVGDVALDSSDMAGELAILRRTASGLEPGGLRTKVLLPNEQIKYLTIDTAGLDDVARRDAAETALDGATPYAVKDLAFDISIDGDQTHIAAVARETLAEAESFAVDHRFHPVCWAAIPNDNAFLGEPFFGVTSAAAELLAEGETVEPDGIAVVVVGSVNAPKGPVVDAPHVPDAVEAPTAAEPEEATPTEPAAQKTSPPVAEPSVAEPAVSKQDRAQAPIEDPTDQKEDLLVATEQAAPMPAPDPASAPEIVEAARIVQQDPPPPAAIGFASRRAAEKTGSPELGGVRRDAPPAQGAVIAAHLDIEPDAVATPPVPAPPPPAAEPAPAAAARSGFLSRRKVEKPAAAGAQPTPAAAITEEDQMTIFGNRKTNVGGKPRFLGLILTAALLVFLAGVAAWASVFLDDGLALSRIFGDRTAKPTLARVEPAPSTAAPAQEAVIALPETLLPEVPETEPTVRTASLDPTLSSEDAAVLDALSEPVTPPASQPLSQAEIEAKYAATGIWAQGPDVPPEPAGLVNTDDLYLTSIDPVSTAADAVALPAMSAFDTDLIVASVSSPAAAGTLFALDPEGLVIPTAQGALSPDGFTVYLGPPPLVPPTTPTRFQSEPVDTRLRSELAALRPQPRPADLVENTERAQLDGLTRSELAKIRPALRPQSLQQKAEAAAAPPEVPEEEPIVTDGAVALALAPQNTIENATKQAVRTSIRPDGRPRNFARIVKRAKRAAPEDPVRVASAAAVAPRVVKPKIPTRASVARQATVKNAINLRKVNLIGVYGKPSSRRALVRLGNGRYKKVVVGDRIDGGRVAAISESELRYVKGGRNVTLSMPR